MRLPLCQLLLQLQGGGEPPSQAVAPVAALPRLAALLLPLQRQLRMPATQHLH